jgi:hypothetical protein
MTLPLDKSCELWASPCHIWIGCLVYRFYRVCFPMSIRQKVWSPRKRSRSRKDPWPDLDELVLVICLVLGGSIFFGGKIDLV